MRIIVVGNGKVGYTISEQLANEKHDVVVIDQDEDVLRRTEDSMDVLCIRGNGANASTLLEAGAERSDIIMAITAGDEINMLCGLTAKRLGTKYAIARIRDPEYNESVDLLQSALDIDLAVNPEKATALEISRLLRFPFAANIEAFAKGRVELVSFVAGEDKLVGIPLNELNKRLPELPRVLFALIDRNGEIITPHGEDIIQAGDKVYVAGDIITVTNFFSALGRNTGKVKNIMVLGGGRISYYLAKMLEPMGIKITLIEILKEKAEMLAEQLPGVNVINGDGTNQSLLNEEGLESMDAFVALSSRDEENLMTGLYARNLGVKKVIVKNNRSAYNDILFQMGLDSIVSPKDITCAYLLRYVRSRLNANGAKVERLYRLMDGKVEMLEFIARAGDMYIGVPIRDLHIKPGTLITFIVRRGKVIIPFGGDHVETGDRVVVISPVSGLGDLNEVIHR